MFNVDTVLKVEARLTLDPKVEISLAITKRPQLSIARLSNARVNAMRRHHFSNRSHFLSFPCVCQSKAVLCPMSGRPIKMNELITVRFTPLDASLERVALLTRQVSLHLHLVALPYRKLQEMRNKKSHHSTITCMNQLQCEIISSYIQKHFSYV